MDIIFHPNVLVVTSIDLAAFVVGVCRTYIQVYCVSRSREPSASASTSCRIKSDESEKTTNLVAKVRITVAKGKVVEAKVAEATKLFCGKS
jgi:hypothetical protein